MVDPTLEDGSGVTLAGEPGTVPSGGARSRDGIEFLSPGALLGRYVVIDRLGVGGMGVVYSAYDPELDRKIAVKVLHGRTSRKGSQGAARLVREAQALARLSHPNVVAVHDVGTFEDRVFVAMEFVSGHTLNEWLDRAPRTRPEVLRVMNDAGRGLAAAHAAGLIHRDFKPENVMVREDGRVLVMDFGVARPTDAPPDAVDVDQTTESMIRAQVDRTIDLTRTGALLGTPAYMAPEQHTGKEVDARSDQFAFCVTLYEALYRERPFGGDSLMALAYQVANGQVRAPPANAKVPTRLRRVVLRGLSVKPDDRFASMEALLAQLAIASRGRGRLVAGLGAVAVIAGVASAGPLVERRQTLACAAEGDRVHEIWNEAARVRVESALAGTDLDVNDLLTRLAPWLGRYTDDLARIGRENCLDREVRSTRSQALLGAAKDCLSDRTDALAVLVDELEAGDRDLAIRSVQAAAALPPTTACERERELIARVAMPDAEVREQVREVRRALLRAGTLASAARYPESEKIVREAAKTASALGYAPLDAEIELALAGSLEAQAKYEEAAASAEKAFTIALGEGHDEVAAKAAKALVYGYGVKLAKTDEGERWEAIARGLLHRIDAEDGLLAARLDVTSGTVQFIKGEYDAAEAAFERARSTYESALGADHPDVATVYNLLGILSLVRGQYDQAIDFHHRALTIRENALGPMHPTVGGSQSNLGNVYYTQEKYEKAVEAYRVALEIAEHVYGPDHPDVGTGLNNLGNALDLMKDREGALEAYARSLAIREKAFGADHPMVAQTLHNIGIVQRVLERYDEAEKTLLRARDVKAKTVGEEHDSYGLTLLELGRLKLKTDDPAAARDYVEKALAIAEKSQGGPYELADARFTLGRALFALDPRSARARELAQQALEALPEGEHQKLRGEIENFLAELAGD
jgi:tetratricopeptide (TPR) repeat protein/predicted Ser/Thr protein kinase